MTRGFVISFDALIAASMVFMMLMAATAYLASAKFESREKIALRQFGNDALAVLEKSGELEYAVQNDRVSGIRQFLNKLPHIYCAELKVYPTEDLNNPDFLVLRPGCNKNFLDYTSAKRVFIVDNDDANICLAEMNMWYRVRE